MLYDRRHIENMKQKEFPKQTAKNKDYTILWIFILSMFMTFALFSLAKKIGWLT